MYDEAIEGVTGLKSYGTFGIWIISARLINTVVSTFHAFNTIICSLANVLRQYLRQWNFKKTSDQPC